MIRLTIARSRQLSFLVDGKKSERFDRGDDDISHHVIAVNNVRHIIDAEELHSGKVGVQLSYFAVEPLPEVIRDIEVANFLRYLEF